MSLNAFLNDSNMSRRNQELVSECLCLLLDKITLFKTQADEEAIPPAAFVGLLNKHLISICIAGYVRMGVTDAMMGDMYRACLEEAKEFAKP